MPPSSSSSSPPDLKHLSQILQSGALPGPVLVLSEDTVRRARILNAFRKGISGRTKTGIAAFKKFNCAELNEAQFRELRDAFSSLSLFSTEQFLILENPAKLAVRHEDVLAEILEKGSKKTHVLLHGVSLPSRSAIRKICAKLNLVFELPTPEKFELARWVEKELKTEGLLSWDSEVPHKIIEFTAGSLDAVAQVVKILALSVEGPKVSLADFERLFQISSQDSDFALLDAILAGQTTRAEVLAAQKTSSNAFGLLSLLQRNLAQLATVRQLNDRGVARATMQQDLGINPFVFRKLMGLVDCYSPERLLQCFRSLLKIESRLKNRSLGADSLVGELAFQFEKSKRNQTRRPA